MPTYEYIGDVDTVFVSLVKDDHTWLASKGDQITVDSFIDHPLLVNVSASLEEPKASKKAAAADESRKSESTVKADEPEEN